MNHNMIFVLSAETKINFIGESNAPIRNILEIFQRDMEKVFGKIIPEGEGKETEIVLWKATVEDGLDLEAEGFEIRFEINGKKAIMCMIGKDDLGLIYGLLHISKEYLGISPFWFWNDKEPKVRRLVEIPMTKFKSEPQKIKYRGWFVNDEVLLTAWKADPLAQEVWRPVFEALLRCGGNMVIPGTDKISFHNRELPSEMGLYITHHHAEPLGAEMFLRAYPTLEPRYDKHGDLFEKLWQEAIVKQKDGNVIWNLGFRGQGDYAFWDFDPTYKTPKDRGALISKVIRKQYDMVKESVKDSIFCTNLYGEIMELYREGFLEFPEGVIKIWADSGYGKMVSRRQHNENPRIDALPEAKDCGPHGIYYHATFYDLQASNHLTMLPNSTAFVQKELNAAFQANADELLIVNCGNVKPHVYILDYISELWKNGYADPEEHLSSFVEMYFNSSAQGIRQCYVDYVKASLQYGVNDDERVGEQFYHHPARIMIGHLIKGEQDNSEPLLEWMIGKTEFNKQIGWYKDKCLEHLELWRNLRAKCEEQMQFLTEEQGWLFQDTLLLQVILHASGCSGAVSLCNGMEAYYEKDYAKAFVWISEAISEYQQGVDAMKFAEHGKWENFYQNDCLTNVKLTVYCLDTFRRYLRVLGDWPNFFSWERYYLFEKTERDIFAESAYFNQLSDQELYQRLKIAGLPF